jgi:hypothetical protein
MIDQALENSCSLICIALTINSLIDSKILIKSKEGLEDI